MIPFETTRDDVRIGYIYSATPHRFYGLAVSQYGNPRLHGVCSCEHRTEQAAMRCARRMTKVARA